MSADMSEVNASEMQENARKRTAVLDKIVKIAMRTNSSPAPRATIIAELDDIINDLGGNPSTSSISFVDEPQYLVEVSPEAVEARLLAESIGHVCEILDRQKNSHNRNILYPSISKITINHHVYHTDESDSDSESKLFKLLQAGM